MSADNQNLGEIKIAAMQTYLIAIGFELIAEVGHSLAFRHSRSDTVVTLTKSDGLELVRPADLLSIRFRLEAEGLISDHAVAELNQGRLPIAS